MIFKGGLLATFEDVIKGNDKIINDKISRSRCGFRLLIISIIFTLIFFNYFNNAFFIGFYFSTFIF